MKAIVFLLKSKLQQIGDLKEHHIQMINITLAYYEGKVTL
jgi:hypothetical protein